MIRGEIIRATCRYQAKKNAEAFDYDYLAKRTAEEVCMRLQIIKNQEAHNAVKNDEISDICRE